VFTGLSLLWHGQQHSTKAGDAILLAQEALDAELKEQTKNLKLALLHLRSRKSLVEDFKSRNRDALYQDSIRILEQMYSEDRPTHLYFMDKDGINFLRAHQPDRHGDVIDRFTMLKAARTGATAVGIELGPLGTLTLRVVAPWVIDGELIGYVELGEDIQHILDELTDSTQLQTHTAIYKKYLDRASWEAGSNMLGRDGAWDNLTSFVLVSPNEAGLSAKAIASHLRDYETSMDSKTAEVFLDSGKWFRISLLPLRDAGDRRIGYTAITYDVTAEQAALWQSIAIMVVVLVVTAIGLSALFWIITRRLQIRLDRAEKAQRASYGELEERVEERTRELTMEITDRERAEERLHDAVESIADGFVLFDGEDRVVMWNQCFAEMYPELAAMLPDRPTAEALFRERHRAGALGRSDISSEEYVAWRMEMRRKDGGTPVVHRHSDGNWVRSTERPTTEGGIVSINTDVTVLKNRELELREAVQQAETADRAKSEFLANMSHELRTPLNAVIAFSEIIKDETFGPFDREKYRDYANDINNSGQHLLELINDILDISKIESGTDELHEERIEIPRIIASALKLVEQRAAQGDIKLEFEPPDRLLTLYADERKLKQILVNLLSNAVKFTDPGGAVTLRAWCRLDSGYVFQISDTGIGIAPEDIRKVLSRFGQADEGLNRRYDGTGLGLPLTKALVEQHGGTLDLQSKVGIGTTATVRFPAIRVVAPPGHSEAFDMQDRAAG
jgi:PAS domain S-box-containing protein